MAKNMINKRNYSKQQVVVLCFGTNQAAIALLLQWILSEHGVNNVRVLVFDADGTRVYPNLPRPTNEGFLQVDFQAGTFQIVQTPGPNTIAGIMAGQYLGKAGFGSVNEFAQGNGGTKGTGGSPLCGRITAVFNRQSIVSSLEKVLRDILEQRHHDANDNDDDVLIYAVFSEYGGCASGMREEVLIVMDECVERTVKTASLYQVLIIPGIDKPKDLLQSGSIAFAGLAEIAAAATGRFFTLRQYENDTEPKIYRVPHVRTIVLSNFNNAQGKPVALDRTRQTALVARLLEYQATSAIGKRVEGELLDFDDDARSQTANGEFRGVKSVGMSLINLDRPRLHEFATASIVARTCDALLRDIPGREIQDLAEAFFRENRLLEGEGFTMLSTSLLISQNGVGRINFAERAQGVILRSLNGQVGVQAVNAAVSAVEAARDIVAASQDQIRNGVEGRLSNLRQAIDERYNAVCRNYNWGVATGMRWLSTLDLMMERLKEVVSESLRDTDDELTQHQAVVNNFRDRIAPAVVRSGFLTRLFNRERFREIARQGLVAIANKSSVELRYSAIQQAMEVLNQLHEHVKTRLAQATEIFNIVEAFRAKKMKEREYLLNLDDTYVCPNGHSLINTETIQDYYGRILTNG